MTFIFDEAAGAETLLMKGERYKYLIKVRRHGVGDSIGLRHPQKSAWLYTYSILSIDGRHAQLILKERSEAPVAHPHHLHLGWCGIDPKSIEKVLPQLNELGVAKITFINCERSQNHFTPDYKRYERILLASMQQCGRSQMMTFESTSSVQDFLERYPNSHVLDFCDEVFELGQMKPETVVIGPEGGFCDEERAQMGHIQRVRLKTPMILRSETVAVAISSAVLL